MIIAAICCRAGSVRVPNKALRVVNGVTLLERAIRQAKTIFTRVIVSTDSSEIGRSAYLLGAEVVQRPAHLATSEASKWDVFRHLADYSNCDTLVDLDVSCPLRSDADITACIRRLPDFDVVATAYESDRNPYFNMVDAGGNLAIQGDTLIENSQDAPKVYSLSPAVFAIRADALFEYDHWSEVPCLGIHIIPRERAWDIDTELDLEIVQFLAVRK